MKAIYKLRIKMGDQNLWEVTHHLSKEEALAYLEKKKRTGFWVMERKNNLPDESFYPASNYELITIYTE